MKPDALQVEPVSEPVRCFRRDDAGALYHSFLKAFAGYKVNMEMSYNYFEKRIFDKLHVDHDLSAVWSDGEGISAFILHAVNRYKGLKTAYNGGTGVIPGQRGKGLTQRLYDFLYPSLKQKGVKKVVLEVLTGNQAAIRTYEKIGFEYARTLKCFIQRTKMEPYHQPASGIDVIETAAVSPAFDAFHDFHPGFLDQSAHLVFNLKNEKILEARQSGKLAGYVVFQSHLGRISQLAVARESRRRGVGSRLLYEARLRCGFRNLTVMNVPESAEEMTLFLKKNGFYHELDQNEMEWII